MNAEYKDVAVFGALILVLLNPSQRIIRQAGDRKSMMQARLKDAFITALIAAILALPLAGVRTEDGINGLVIEWRLGAVAVAAALVFAGRLFWGLAQEGNPAALIATLGGIAAIFLPFPTLFLQTAAVGIGLVVGARFCWVKVKKMAARLPRPSRAGAGGGGLHPGFKFPLSLTTLSYLLILAALIFPFTPLANRYALDVSIMVMTYIMLAWGLNITVGYAGLLDLGYAGFYALGAYCYALLATHTVLDSGNVCLSQHWSRRQLAFCSASPFCVCAEIILPSSLWGSVKSCASSSSTGKILPEAPTASPTSRAPLSSASNSRVRPARATHPSATIST